MRRRGRPPYPDVLTPKQWEVLELIREGLSDQDIADRLGLSLAGAKYHVSEILSKLGVATRDEAARWVPGGRRVRGRVSPWFTRVVFGTGVAISAAAVSGLALLGWAVLGTSADGSGPTSLPEDERVSAVVPVEDAIRVAEDQLREEIELGEMTFVRSERTTYQEWFADLDQRALENGVGLHSFAETTPINFDSEPPLYPGCAFPPPVEPERDLWKVTFNGYIYLKSGSPESFDIGGCRELEFLVVADTGVLVYETYEVLDPPYPPSVCDSVPPAPIRPD